VVGETKIVENTLSSWWRWYNAVPSKMET